MWYLIAIGSCYVQFWWIGLQCKMQSVSTLGPVLCCQTGSFYALYSFVLGIFIVIRLQFLFCLVTTDQICWWRADYLLYMSCLCKPTDREFITVEGFIYLLYVRIDLFFILLQSPLSINCHLWSSTDRYCNSRRWFLKTNFPECLHLFVVIVLVIVRYCYSLRFLIFKKV